MAKTSNSKSKSHFFLSCFGFSGKIRRFKPLNKPTAAHKKRPFSWMLKFRPEPPPQAVRSDFPADQNRSSLDFDRVSWKSIAQITTHKSSNEDFAVALPVATDRAGEKIRPEEVKNDIVVEKPIISESCKHSDSPKKTADESQSRFSLTRRLESFRSGRFAQPAPPTTKKKPKSTAISHSLSFPSPNPVRISRTGFTSGETGKKNRHVTGMSILMVTLVIMVLWGKFCAILCTATWICIIKSLRSIVEEDAIDIFESDPYSQGLKKKLVDLKGFLC